VASSHAGSCCLAIGDGANDVAMIKAGHIGVGIIGREGMEAVNNSDFAIGQFRFLRGLVFVHGRQNYRRYAKFCYFMFYQSTVMVFSLFWYSLLALASGAQIYPWFILDLFTVFYTPLPLIVVSVNDQDVPKSESAVTPRLYTAGIQRTHLTSSAFNRWIMEAIYVGALLAYLPAAAYGWGPNVSMLSSSGDPSWGALSFTAYNALILVVLLRLAFEVQSWTMLEVGAWLLSLAALVLTNVMFAYWYPVPFPTVPDSQWGDFVDIISIMYSLVPYWLTLICLVLLGLFPAFVKVFFDFHPASPITAALKRVAHLEELVKSRVFEEERNKVKTAWLSIPSGLVAQTMLSQRQSRGSAANVSYEPSMKPMSEVSLRSVGRQVAAASAFSNAVGVAWPTVEGGLTQSTKSSEADSPLSVRVPGMAKRGSGFAFSQDNGSSKHVLGLLEDPNLSPTLQI